jgi:hypothetical protein
MGRMVVGAVFDRVERCNPGRSSVLARSGLAETTYNRQVL